MKNRCGTFFLVMLTIGSAGPAMGESFEWGGSGGGSTDWRTAENWYPRGYPKAGDTAVFMSGPSDWPTFSNDESVDFLVINGGAELTVLSATLTIIKENGLTVDRFGELKIGAGTLKLLGGGLINLNGTITLQGPTGTLLLSETSGEVYTIPPSGTAEIVGITSSYPSTIGGVGDAVLVIEAGVEILGDMNIEVALVNNGIVDADRAGSLTLACREKSGNGFWKVSHASARMVTNVPIAGGPCAVVEITAGVLEVNSNWVSCGSLWMLDALGKIEVAAKKTFRAGSCGGTCNCASR